MTDEERAVLSLPPKLQKRMAMLVLLGWKIGPVEGPTLTGIRRPRWRAIGPSGRAQVLRWTLLTLLDDLVGYDVVHEEAEA